MHRFFTWYGVRGNNYGIVGVGGNIWVIKKGSRESRYNTWEGKLRTLNDEVMFIFQTIALLVISYVLYNCITV